MAESAGKVLQVMGPVIDVEFPPGQLPEIYSALRLTNQELGDDADNLVIEVAQHLGENTVRCIAMDSTEGLRRGQPVTNTSAPIPNPAVSWRVRFAGFARLSRLRGTAAWPA